MKAEDRFLGDGQIVEQVITLEDHADPLPCQVGSLLAVQRVDGSFAKPVFAQPAVIKQGEHIQQR